MKVATHPVDGTQRRGGMEAPTPPSPPQLASLVPVVRNAG
jgi:hypothetical protein